jgi:undecaprenyl-diphosphatase
MKYINLLHNRKLYLILYPEQNMNLLQSILLGILQGIAEFLPVSSSGHLILARHLMNIEEIPVIYDILLHVATLAAVIIIFRKRVINILVSLFNTVKKQKTDNDKESLRIFYLIIIATAATIVIALLVDKLQDFIVFDYKFVSALFIVTGIILIISKFFKGSREYLDIRTGHALIIGAAQGLGVFPGISRSGITITASIGTGLTRDRAGEISFLISIPAILAALVYDLKDLEVIAVDPLVIAAGMITAFFVGLVSLILLLKIIKSGRFYVFSFYLIPLGIAFLIFF